MELVRRVAAHFELSIRLRNARSNWHRDASAPTRIGRRPDAKRAAPAAARRLAPRSPRPMLVKLVAHFEGRHHDVLLPRFQRRAPSARRIELFNKQRRLAGAKTLDRFQAPCARPCASTRRSV